MTTRSSMEMNTHITVIWGNLLDLCMEAYRTLLQIAHRIFPPHDGGIVLFYVEVWQG